MVQGIPLESQYRGEVFAVDLAKPCDFHTYLAPNESSVEDLQGHIQMKGEGLIVLRWDGAKFFRPRPIR